MFSSVNAIDTGSDRTYFVNFQNENIQLKFNSNK